MKKRKMAKVKGQTEEITIVIKGSNKYRPEDWKVVTSSADPRRQ